MDRKVILYLFCVLSLVGCYNSFDTVSDEKEVIAPQPNVSIEVLHQLYDRGVRDIDEPMITYGVVSANDKSGNLFMSFMVESKGYALELLDGLYDSHARHPLGALVVINLEGLRMERRAGVLRVGLPTDESAPYALDYMRSEAIVDRHIYVKHLASEVEPASVTLSNIDVRYAGRLICVEGLSYYAEPLEQSRWGGRHLFRDENLDSLWCETSDYAAFAHDNIPLGEVSLVGIYSVGVNNGRQRIIKLRSEMDCIY